MNFSFLSKYWPYYLEGMKNTVLLALVTVILGGVIGLLLVLGRISGKRPLRFFTGAYVEFVRGTPLLVQLFIIYYGLPALGVKFYGVAKSKPNLNLADLQTVKFNRPSQICNQILPPKALKIRDSK